MEAFMQTDACLSHLRCDQLLNGELDDEPTARAHVATCRRCRDRLDQHERERAHFAVPLGPRRRRALLVASLGAAFAMAAAIALVAAPRADHGGSTRTKGAASIGFFVKHGEVVRRGGAGERVAPGDALEFTASSDRLAYLAIISVDAAQVASAYYPDAAMAAPIAAGADQVLPLSVVLDQVTGTERIRGVFCDHPFAVEAMKAQIAAGAAAPDGCTIDALTIEKRSAP